MRRVVVVAMLAACGRLGFDPRGDVTGDGPGAGDGTQQGDGAGSGSSNAVLVQVSTAVQNVGPTTVNLPQPTSAGTLLVANFGVNNLSGVTPPAGWQINANGSVSGSCVAVIASDTSGTAGRQTFAFTLPAGAPIIIVISEWSGIPLGNAFDSGGFGGGTSPTTALTITSVLPNSAAGDLGIVTFCEDTTNPVFTAGNGWTALAQGNTTASSPSMIAEYQMGEPAQKVTATATSSVSVKYAAVIATLHTQ